MIVDSYSKNWEFMFIISKFNFRIRLLFNRHYHSAVINLLFYQPKFVKRYFVSPTKLFNSFYDNRFKLITSVTMTAIATARQSKINWMNTDFKHCSRLNNKRFDTILIRDSLTAGVTRFSKVWNKFFKPHNAFICGKGGHRVQHVLWRAHDLRLFSSLRNVVILCGTNNLYTRIHQRKLRMVLLK